MNVEPGARSSGVVRGVVLALVASLLMWFAVQWGLTILEKPLYEQRDVDGLLTMSRVGLVAGPVLSAIIGVLLLPDPLRGRLGPALLVGTPMTIVACAVSVVTFNAGSSQQAILAGLGLIALAAVTAGITAAVTRRGGHEDSF